MMITTLGALVEKAHKFASTQVNLEPMDAGRVQGLARLIHDDDLAADGREDEPHITVKYGLHTDDPAEVRAALADEHEPLYATLGRCVAFEGVEDGTADAVVIEVQSTCLRRANKKLSDTLAHTNTHREYRPHLTIAYVKPGLGAYYAELFDDALKGVKLEFDEIVFSSKDDKTESVVLKGDKAGHKFRGNQWAGSSEAMFHGTRGDALESIMKEGLRPNAVGQSWATTSLRDAKSFAFTADQENLTGVVLEIRAPEGSFTRVKNGLGDTRARFEGHIKPEWIVGIKAQIEDKSAWADFETARAIKADELIYIPLIMSDDGKIEHTKAVEIDVVGVEKAVLTTLGALKARA